MKALVVRHGSVTHRGIQIVCCVAAAVIVLFLAAYEPDYRLVNYGSVAAWAVALLGLNLVVGYSGQFTFSQSAFFGLGGYVTAILVSDHGWPFLATLPVVAVAGAVVGLVLGLPALRVRGHYLAIISFALVVAFPSIVNMDQLRDLTGGANGKSAFIEWSAPAWFPIAMSDRGWQFLTLAALAVLLFWLVSNALRSRVGRALMAMRDNEIGAAASGISLALWKASAFAIGSALAALGGAMLLLVVPIVGPDSGGFLVALELITGLLLGGSGTIAGAAIGGAAIVWLPQISQNLAGSLPFLDSNQAPAFTNVVYGAILVVVIFVMPGGIVSFLRRARGRFLPIKDELPPPSDPAGAGSFEGLQPVSEHSTVPDRGESTTSPAGRVTPW
ncbi:branched-chain amino acid ABC transporter permease [Pseudofrankia inefficax]|uniref:Inner-membrane translocator n=1 Tax=Pseudofrankia inefficax (strain DSM 45817 / CECT 9037 / DDB 130130 / EuI1c) TaxID=298654 RepID=E3IVA1_PSEI1|nr:branched-chain amino acid ABC transporter permease [Pseudofrankia inefficax]ADP81265.1 inner-membrane translocator [Pseudofrankia inefficax]